MADVSAIVSQRSVVASTGTVKTSTTALAANSARGGWQVQNLDTGVLYVLLGAGASTSNYHMVLKAGSSAADGTGGSYAECIGVIYTGLVSVASAGTPSYAVFEK
jgi:hypothetical protein